jgi:transcriptional regulator with XRE-family HTH domain
MNRSAIKRITKEATIVRFMRMSRKISMRQAAQMLNLSDSLISHIEQGRQDLPRKRAEAMVSAYGYTWADFELFLAADEIPYADPKDACIQMLDRIPTSKLSMVLTILRGFVS